jgi:cytochrome c peroxidase
MRFEREAKHGANAGLHVARGLLEPLHKKYPSLSISDLWQFAAVVAIEEMGGPKIPFRPGRVDKPDESHCTPDGRLPDAAQGPQHLRDIFCQ